MKTLCETRGQLVRENPQLRFGEVKFVPALGRAEMSQETWELLQVDEDKGRAYAVARSRAFRNTATTAMSVLPKAEATRKDSLDQLERQAQDLVRLMHAIKSDPGADTSVELITRRKEIKALQLKIQARVREVGDLLSVVDELLDAKVLV